MPYRHAHYYLSALLGLSVVAFWPVYFAVMPRVTIDVHIHGFTASLWILLLAFQSWTIHHQHIERHRVGGMASLVAFPFFFAGTVLIVHTIARNYAAGDLFDGRFGARFVAFDLVALVAIALLYWSALRHRRNVHAHSRYMFATAFFLFQPIFTRLLARFVPGLRLAPPDFSLLPTNVELSSLGALLLALTLALKKPKHARPWLITAGLLGLQMALFNLGGFSPWDALVRAIGGLPAPLLYTVGVGAGAVVSWLGWHSIPAGSARPVQILDAAEGS